MTVLVVLLEILVCSGNLECQWNNETTNQSQSIVLLCIFDPPKWIRGINYGYSNTSIQL